MAETTTTASPTALAMELQNEKRKLAMDLARQLEDVKRQRREAASGGSGAPSIAAAAAADEPVSRADVLREIAGETEVTPLGGGGGGPQASTVQPRKMTRDPRAKVDLLGVLPGVYGGAGLFIATSEDGDEDDLFSEKLTKLTNIKIDDDSDEVSSVLDDDASLVFGSLEVAAERTAQVLLDDQGYLVAASFSSKWIKHHMLTEKGMNLSMNDASRLASLGEQNVGQPAISDICSGLAARSKSAAVLPTLILALKYRWLVASNERARGARASAVSASQLGFDGELGSRKKSATAPAAAAEKWPGVCDSIKITINQRIKWIADKLPPATTVFPVLKDEDIMAIIPAAWKKIELMVGQGKADAAIKRAHALGKAKWQGTENGASMLEGRAAVFITNHWTRNAGPVTGLTMNCVTYKKQLLTELKLKQPEFDQPSGTSGAAAAASSD